MRLFSFFKKKHKEVFPTEQGYSPDPSWAHGSIDLSPPPGMEEPLQPLAQLRPPPLEKLQSVETTDMHMLLDKLDGISKQLELLTQRLERLEQSLRPRTPPQPYPQQATYPLPRW